MECLCCGDPIETEGGVTPCCLESICKECVDQNLPFDCSCYGVVEGNSITRLPAEEILSSELIPAREEDVVTREDVVAREEDVVATEEYVVVRDEYVVARNEYVVARNEYVVARNEYVVATEEYVDRIKEGEQLIRVLNECAEYIDKDGSKVLPLALNEYETYLIRLQSRRRHLERGLPRYVKLISDSPLQPPNSLESIVKVGMLPITLGNLVNMIRGDNYTMKIKDYLNEIPPKFKILVKSWRGRHSDIVIGWNGEIIRAYCVGKWDPRYPPSRACYRINSGEVYYMSPSESATPIKIGTYRYTDLEKDKLRRAIPTTRDKNYIAYQQDNNNFVVYDTITNTSQKVFTEHDHKHVRSITLAYPYLYVMTAWRRYVYLFECSRNDVETNEIYKYDIRTGKEMWVYDMEEDEQAVSILKTPFGIMMYNSLRIFAFDDDRGIVDTTNTIHRYPKLSNEDSLYCYPDGTILFYQEVMRYGRYGYLNSILYKSTYNLLTHQTEDLPQTKPKKQMEPVNGEIGVFADDYETVFLY